MRLVNSACRLSDGRILCELDGWKAWFLLDVDAFGSPWCAVDASGPSLSAVGMLQTILGFVGRIRLELAGLEVRLKLERLV